MSVKIEGADVVIKNLDKYSKQKTQEIQGVIDMTAQLVRTDAIKSMQSSPASGTVYVRRTVTHTASSRGNPPRVDTGRLVNSVKALVGKLEAFVGTAVMYGRYLEFGVNGDQNARPWLFPAYERQRRNFVNRLKAVLK